MFRFALAILILAATASAAHAISRHDTARLSCSRIQAILKAEGTAILRYPSRRNPNRILYDAYSASSRCTTGGRGRPATVPAADTKACPVNRCVRNRGGR